MEAFSEVLWSGSIALVFCIAFVRRTAASIVFACAFIASIALDPWYWPASQLIAWNPENNDGVSRIIGDSLQKYRALHYSWRLTLGAVTAIAMAIAARRLERRADARTPSADPGKASLAAPAQLSIRSIFALISLSAWYVKALQNPTPLFQTITVVITISLLAFAAAHAAKTKSTASIVFLCVALTFFYFPPMSRFRREIILSLGTNDFRKAYTILRHAVAITTSATIAVFGLAFIREVKTNKVMRVVASLALLTILYLASYDFVGINWGQPTSPIRVFPNKTIGTFYRPAARLESLYAGYKVQILEKKEWEKLQPSRPLNRLKPLRVLKRGRQ